MILESPDGFVDAALEGVADDDVAAALPAGRSGGEQAQELPADTDGSQDR